MALISTFATCSLFQLSGRKVNILPSYVIFHFVNVDIPEIMKKRCEILILFNLKYPNKRPFDLQKLRVPLWKDLDPVVNIVSAQETDSILKISFAFSK